MKHSSKTAGGGALSQAVCAAVRKSAAGCQIAADPNSPLDGALPAMPALEVLLGDVVCASDNPPNTSAATITRQSFLMF
jgi:hypothetical protein